MAITIIKLKPAPKTEVAHYLEPNMLADEVERIENLSQDEVIQSAHLLNEEQSRNHFSMGGYLSCIRKNTWFGRYKNFNAWANTDLGMKPGKAHALANIYDNLANAEISAADVNEIGWTKLRAIARVINKENASFWINLALNCSKAELNEKVRTHSGKEIPVITKTFKYYADQDPAITMALKKAKAVGDTEHDGVALEYICLDYMSGQAFEKSVNQLSASSMVDLIVSGLKDRDDATIEHILREVLNKLGAGEFSYP